MHHFYRFIAERLGKLADKLHYWSGYFEHAADEAYWAKHPEELEELRAGLARTRAFLDKLMDDTTLLDTASDLGHCTCPACRARTIN